jgi:hypothetical protein
MTKPKQIPGTPYLSLADITFRSVNKVQSPRAERKVKVKVKVKEEGREEDREEDRSKVRGPESRVQSPESRVQSRESRIGSRRQDSAVLDAWF